MVWRSDAFVPLPREEVPPPEPGSPFGRIYFNANIDKNHAVGKASYHFQTPDKCFISYDTAPDEWKFDDGSLIRAGMPIIKIESTTFDAATRTFTGLVFLPKPAFNGELRWKFSIVFSEDFAETTGGAVAASKLPQDGLFVSDWTKTMSFGTDNDSTLYLEYVATPSPLVAFVSAIFGMCATKRE